MEFDGKELIYLDYNATTPIDPRVLEAMMPFLTNNFANAASTHKFGVGAHEAVKEARKSVATLFGADTNEIVFTSGATEAINLALKGVAEQLADKGKHIITVQTEHKAVLDVCSYLETKGFEVTYLPVLPDGRLDIETYKAALRNDTILVCVMHVNNETGVIQDIPKLAGLAHSNGSLFFSDCTQSAGKIPVNVDELDVDFACLSAHKIYGPKGIGALYVRQRKNRIKIPALIHGGGHERGLRSGTLNVPGIVGLGMACELALKEMEQNKRHIESLRDYLESELLVVDNVSVNGSITHRLYNVSNLLFKGVDSDALIMGLSDPKGKEPIVTVSNGSACTAASIDPSHVLLALGLNETDSFCSIRFSLGSFTTKDQIDSALKLVSKQVHHLKAMFT